MRDKIFIVAGNYNQFLEYRNRKWTEYREAGIDISIDDFVYVSSPDSIRGRRNVHGFYIGTWDQRPDIEDIKLNIKLANV
jgi:hypothetical protein